MAIRERVGEILAALPRGTTLVAATKGRTVAEVMEAIEGGVTVVGENYIREAALKHAEIGPRAEWHIIGHVQRNKVKEALSFADMIETVDSLHLAAEIGRCAVRKGTVFPVLIEINSGREPQKAGVMPENAEALAAAVSCVPGVRVEGLMTMGPFLDDPEAVRPFFRETRRLFDALRALALPNTDMRRLSMGMSGTWRIAVEEGATLVRVGTSIFGPRPPAGT